MSNEPFWVDGLQPEYRLGAAIAGRVLLPDVDRATVAVVFETSGGCDAERAVLREVEVGPGPGWVPFAIDGPRWPPSYDGPLFSGDWYLELDPGSRTGSTVLRRALEVSSGTPIDVRPATGTVSPVKRGGGGLGTRLAVLIALELACAVLIVVGAMRGSWLWIAGLAAAIVLVLPTVGTTLGVLSKRATGGMTVDVVPRAGALAVRAEFGSSDVVEQVTAALVVREKVQRFTGTDRPERREIEIHRHEVPLIRQGDRAFGTVLATPRDGAVPPTFNHSTAQVVWTLHVTAQLRGAPDVESTVLLIARPAA